MWERLGRLLVASGQFLASSLEQIYVVSEPTSPMLRRKETPIEIVQQPMATNGKRRSKRNE